MDEDGNIKLKIARKWLIAYAEGAGIARGSVERRWEFTLGGQSLAPSQVFADDGMLPALLWAAESLYSSLFPKGFGLNFVEQDKRVSLCGAVLAVEKLDVPISHILLFAKKVVDSYAMLNPNPQRDFVLDALYMDWDSAKHLGSIPGVPLPSRPFDISKD